MKRIIVLGMHRSGATALARMVALLGASTGDPAHLRDTGENTALRKVNDALLEGAGGAWDGPPPGDDWLDSATSRGLIERGRYVLAAEFGDTALAVWKDPRNALTLPFWVELLDEEPVIVLVHRHPAEVAASMKLTYSTRPGHAYALWERYNAAALTASTGLRTIVMDYGQLMSFPAEAAAFVSKALAKWDVELPNDPATTDVELSASRRHHVAPDRDHIDAPVATPSQAAVFALLDAVSGAHTPLALPQPVPEPSPVSEELLAMAASIRQLEAERRELRHNERLAKRAAKRAGGAEVVADTDADDADSGAGEPGRAMDQRQPSLESGVTAEFEPVAESPAEPEAAVEPEAAPERATPVPEPVHASSALPPGGASAERAAQGPSVTALPIAAAPELAPAAATGETAAAATGTTAGGAGGGGGGGGGGKNKARRARRRSRRAAAAGAAATDGEMSETLSAEDLSADEGAETPDAPAATAGHAETAAPAVEPVGLPNLPTEPAPAGDLPHDQEPAEPRGVPTLIDELTTPPDDSADHPEPVGPPNLPTETAAPASDAPSVPGDQTSPTDGSRSTPGALAGVSIIDLVLRAKQQAGDGEQSSTSRADGAPTYGDAGPGMPHLRPYGEPEPR